MLILGGFLAVLPVAAALSCWESSPCTGPKDTAFPGPWENNILAPHSRVVSPERLVSAQDGHTGLEYPATLELDQSNCIVTLDFGREVGGTVSLEYTSRSEKASLGLAFTEAKNWIGQRSDSSNGKFSRGFGDLACDDGYITADLRGPGQQSWSMEAGQLRGGFRYLTLFLPAQNATNIQIHAANVAISFDPTWPNLRAYQGYFDCSDDLLNKIWYSGAYTLQTNRVAPKTGRWVPFLSSGWMNNGTLSNGSSVIVDGAKRDRAVWPGDMAIAVPSMMVSLGDLDAVRNALQALFDHQNKDGSLPEAGPPLLQQGSDTYHCWTMVGVYSYVLYSNDLDFLERNWAGYQRALSYISEKVLRPLGLLNVTGTRDWGRLSTGGYNTEANIILYRTLITGSSLATWKGDEALAVSLTTRASMLRENVVKHMFDESYGAFRDNITSTPLYPQDANSMALLFDVVSAENAQDVSERLTKNWTPIGPDSPELPHNISPFISGFEVQGHLAIGQTRRALDLIRSLWGWYLSNPNGTQSTMIEGFLTNGSFGYRNYRGYNYDSSYVSHSHGWSSGPTSALTNYVLGLTVTGLAGKTWSLAPQFGDLKYARGGFVTSLGKFEASWKIEREGYVLEWRAPKETDGTIVLPQLGCKSCEVDSGGRLSRIACDKPYTMSGMSGSGKVIVKAL